MSYSQCHLHDLQCGCPLRAQWLGRWKCAHMESSRLRKARCRWRTRAGGDRVPRQSQGTMEVRQRSGEDLPVCNPLLLTHHFSRLIVLDLALAMCRNRCTKPRSSNAPCWRRSASRKSAGGSIRVPERTSRRQRGRKLLSRSNHNVGVRKSLCLVVFCAMWRLHVASDSA